MAFGATAQVTFLAAASLLAAFVIGHFINTSKIKHCPQSTASILVGVTVGVAIHLFGIDGSLFNFNTSFFYFFLLPPIVLEAGFSLDRPNFLHNIGAILWFAIVGTLVSALVVAEGSYYAGQLFGLQGSDRERRAYCWLLGTLLSAVDPVATLSILGGSRFTADERLFSIVFGESILNDAVAIVIFQTVEKLFFVDRTAPGAMSVILEVAHVTLISLLVGVAVSIGAFGAFRVSKGLKKFPEYELGLLLLLSYFSFALSEILKGSGILTLFIMGSFMGHYSLKNLSPTSQRSSALLFKVLAVLSESFIYVLFGVVFTNYVISGKAFHRNAVVITLLLTLLARALSVFPSCAALNAIWACEPNVSGSKLFQAKTSLRSLLGTLNHQESLSHTPMARSTGRNRIDHLPSNTSSQKYGCPAQVVEEESFFSRQTSLSGRARETLALLPVESETSGRARGGPVTPYGTIYGDGDHGMYSGPLEVSPPGINVMPPLQRQSVADASALKRVVMAGGQGRHQIWVAKRDDGGETSPANIEVARAWAENANLEDACVKKRAYLDFPCQFVLWLSGLRGAIAFALSLAMPKFTDTKETEANRQLVVSTTLAMVLLTTICLGGCIETVALKCGIVVPISRDTESSVSEAHEESLERSRGSFESWPPSQERPSHGGGGQSPSRLLPPTHYTAAHFVRHLSRLTNAKLIHPPQTIEEVDDDREQQSPPQSSGHGRELDEPLLGGRRTTRQDVAVVAGGPPSPPERMESTFRTPQIV